MKAEGQVRYVGITTSEGRRHGEFERIMREQPLDFVQVTYNVLDREVEDRILPLARERGIAVIVNRPFRQGALTERPSSALRCRPGRRRSAARAGRSSSSSSSSRTRPSPAPSRRRPVSTMCARTWAPPTGPCRTRRCAPHDRRMSRSSDVGVVDLLAVGLPAVLAAHLLPALRALQRRDLAGAGRWRSRSASRSLACCCDAAARGRAALVAASSPPAGSGSPGPSPRALRHDQLGRRATSRPRSRSRRCFSLWSASSAVGSPCTRPGRCGRPCRARPLSSSRWRPASDRPASSGGPWPQAEIFGLAPDPTVVATLGVVLRAAARRAGRCCPPAPLVRRQRRDGLDDGIAGRLGDAGCRDPYLRLGTSGSPCHRPIKRPGCQVVKPGCLALRLHI